jgi:AcrR family transcriptional regulator
VPDDARASGCRFSLRRLGVLRPLFKVPLQGRSLIGPRADHTVGAYAGTVGELQDGRARKKARTREQIRTVAQDMFAERGFDSVTIADVAREADVAVQTVFNHFPAKEDLFFDGRVPWVAGPADAVRSRAPGVTALNALRTYLVEAVHDLVGSHSTAPRRCYVATLEASDTLRSHERELVHDAELRLTAALLEAWTAQSSQDESAPDDPVAAAPLVAAIWLAASRSLILGQRPHLTEGADPEQAATTVAELADRVLGQLETNVDLVHGRTRNTAAGTDTDWSHGALRQAG